MLRNSLIALSALLAVPAWGAELKQETLDAWDQYMHASSARMADRAHAGFLWADEAPERVRRIRTGEVVVSQMGHAPEAVPGGLIHHWIGVVFLPGARIEEVISVVRNYERYPEFYKPSIVDARTLSHNPTTDRFQVVVVDKAMFNKRAIDSEYDSRFVQIDGTKWYSIAQTTHVQEVAEPLDPANAHKIPEGEGSGYIWRLSTISRYQERDGGVYIEIEAMALSRSIPGALHWVVDPIVRRVSRASLATSLEQTREAHGSSRRMAVAFGGQR